MSDPVNIKGRLIAFYSDTNRTPYADLDKEGKAELKGKVLAFLKSADFKNAEDTAMELKLHIFRLHGKQNEFEGALKDLYNVESDYNKKWQRLHYVHQANVFLLGMYLYDISPQVRSSVDKEMKRTAGNFLSDANATGEFLFRWRMASIIHDLGYAISLSQNEGRFRDDLETFTHIPRHNFDVIEDIYKFRVEGQEKDLLRQINGRIVARMHFSIMPLVNYLKENNPFSNPPPFYDHGILSAVIFLYLINDLYSKHNEGDPQIAVAGRNLVWDKGFLDGIFPEIAMAVALHNLDSDKYRNDLFDLEKYYSMKSRPFAWLLKVSDMLQEWDKPRTDVPAADRCLDADLTYDITVEDGHYVGPVGTRVMVGARIVVHDFPCKRRDELSSQDNISGEKVILEGFRSSPVKVKIENLKFFDA